ncbi:MAG: peptide deformylase [Candidatus Makaraimicrobium thalassicum]|nr:MAG: peptide deformylase [Candidatus Omnitrophota bacterium]
MGRLEVKIYPDPCLRIRTKPVEQFSRDIKQTLRSMADIMYVSRGIGLAATQVGLGLSVLVVDAGENLMNFVNPVILERSKKKSRMEEGCLSLPGITVNVTRAAEVEVRAQNEEGEFFIKKFDGLPATVIQHEVDHLHGKLIIDYLDPIRRFMAARKLAGSGRGGSGKTCEVVCNAGEGYNGGA